MCAVCLFFPEEFTRPSTPTHVGAVARPLPRAAAAKSLDVYMEAIKWDNAANLYEGYSKQA
jgi:hypothetical protein